MSKVKVSAVLVPSESCDRESIPNLSLSFYGLLASFEIPWFVIPWFAIPLASTHSLPSSSHSLSLYISWCPNFFFL